MSLGRALGSGTLRRVDRGGGPYWVLDYKDAQGVRRRTALGSDKRVAERRRTEVIRQRDLRLDGMGPIEGMSMPLVEVRDLYLSDLAVRVGPKQLRSITDALARVLGWLHVPRVRDLRVLDLMRYRSARLAEGVSNRTVNVETGAMRSMLRWSVTAGLIAENPLAHFKPLPTGERHQRHVRRALGDEEIARLLVAAAEDDAECGGAAVNDRRRRATRVPQAVLWRALLETGARWGELTAATWADLDVERSALTLRGTNTKSGRTRVIPLRRELVVELLALRAVHQRVRMRLVRAGDRMFLSPDGADWAAYTNNARRLLRRVLDRAGIERVDSAGRVIDVHSLRHTALTRMARRGVPLVVTQRIAGHSSPDITSRHYLHVELDDLRVAVEDKRGDAKPALGRSA